MINENCETRGATTTWADGKWENETDTACVTWHDRFSPNRPSSNRIYHDDYDRLVALQP